MELPRSCKIQSFDTIVSRVQLMDRYCISIDEWGLNSICIYYLYILIDTYLESTASSDTVSISCDTRYISDTIYRILPLAANGFPVPLTRVQTLANRVATCQISSNTHNSVHCSPFTSSILAITKQTSTMPPKKVKKVMTLPINVIFSHLQVCICSVVEAH